MFLKNIPIIGEEKFFYIFGFLYFSSKNNQIIILKNFYFKISMFGSKLEKVFQKKFENI